jgi:hypothetical protein
VTHYRRRKHAWQEVEAWRASALSDARRQVHHAAQLVAAVGISYLPKAADDSHTNMQWIAGALASNLVGDRPVRVAVRPHPFALLVVAGDTELASFALHGRSVADAARWIQTQLERVGLDPDRYTLARHYTIPAHAVARGVPFDATDGAAFEQLQRWYDDADALLDAIALERGGSPVRCWPHHFDIATLLAPAPGKSIGLGLEPGDDSYDEPYWYVNLYPQPGDAAALTAAPLDGAGSWHTDGWLGAVLPGSRMSAHHQQEQARAFLTSAIAACERALANG